MVLGDQLESIQEMSPTLQRIRNSISDPFNIENHKIQITTSMGIAIYPNDGTDIETLLAHADAAMYRAKERGSDDYQYHNAEMQIKKETP